MSMHWSGNRDESESIMLEIMTRPDPEYREKSISIFTISVGGESLDIGLIGVVRDLIDAGKIWTTNAPSKEMWTFIMFEDQADLEEKDGPILFNENGQRMIPQRGVFAETKKEIFMVLAGMVIEFFEQEGGVICWES